MTSIHELRQTLWVNTPHGKGIALLVIDYGPQQNTIWVVALKESGQIKHYDSNQITLEVNYTLDLNKKDL